MSLFVWRICFDEKSNLLGPKADCFDASLAFLFDL
jgi:hypothetical protein